MQSSGSLLSSMATEAVTLFLDPGRFRFSTWRNISITVWETHCTVRDAEKLLSLSQRLGREFPQGRSQVLFVPQGVLAPDDETAALLKDIYDPAVSRIACFASILEGGGFWAGAIRSRLTSMRAAGGNAMAFHVNNSVDEVVEWLPAEHAQRTGVTLSANELRTVLLDVRALGTRDDS